MFRQRGPEVFFLSTSVGPQEEITKTGAFQRCLGHLFHVMALGRSQVSAGRRVRHGCRHSTALFKLRSQPARAPFAADNVNAVNIQYETVSLQCDLHGRSDLATLSTSSQLLICFPSFDHRFKLRAKVGHMEGLLVNDDRLCVDGFTTVPLQGIYRGYDGCLVTQRNCYYLWSPLDEWIL